MGEPSPGSGDRLASIRNSLGQLLRNFSSDNYFLINNRRVNLIW